MKPCNKPPLLLAFLSSSNASTAPPDGYPLERVEDVVRNRDDLASAFYNLKKLIQNAESGFYCVQEEKIASVKKIEFQEATFLELQAEKQSLKIFLEELALQPAEKKQKARGALFSSLNVKCVGIASTILNVIPKLCAKETCELDSFNPRTMRR